ARAECFREPLFALAQGLLGSFSLRNVDESGDDQKHTAFRIVDWRRINRENGFSSVTTPVPHLSAFDDLPGKKRADLRIVLRLIGSTVLVHCSRLRESSIVFRKA